MNPSPALTAAIAARDEILRKADQVAERRPPLLATKAQRDQAQAALDELMRADAERLTEWARAGANGSPPVSDTRLRETALRKLAHASETARAADQVLAELDAEHVALAQALKGAQLSVQLARARQFAEQLAAQVAKLRELEDQKVILEAIVGGLSRQTRALDPLTSSEVSTELDRQRVEWINTREAKNQQELTRRWSEIAAIPE